MRAALARSAAAAATRAMAPRSLGAFGRVRLAAPVVARPVPVQLQSAFFSLGAAGGDRDDSNTRDSQNTNHGGNDGNAAATSSDTNDEDKYLELLQLRDIKSEEFYELQGTRRRYFYYIDLQGRLFLENTRPKNIATSLKSAKFLKFFFSHIRPNDPPASAASASRSEPPAAPSDASEWFLEYPYRSPCGSEMNFIKCADRPFVFDDFYRDEGSGEWRFAYGGGELTTLFRPERLKISLSTGRLYHDGPARRQSRTAGSGGGGAAPAPRGGEIALIRSQLAVEFGRSISVLDDPVPRDLRGGGGGGGGGGDAERESVLVIGEFEWEGKRFPIEAID